MKYLKPLILVMAVAVSSPVFAEESKRVVATSDYVVDLALRPIGFIATVTGTGLYIGLSPLTLISHAFPPHQSFQKLGNFLVVTPAKFTFTRPVGDYTLHSNY
ncbi:MAG: hypothetical protein ACPW60_05105 [Methylohalobius sp. ZOD2]|nr:hypothetical protein [Methylothermaceae bacterium]